MKFFAFGIFMAAILALTWAQKDCTLGGKTIKFGEKYQPAGECTLVECMSRGNIGLSGCEGFVMKSSSCKLIAEDATKLYPDCCAHCAK